MTPEERFNKIESLLEKTAEQQARQQEQLGIHGQEIEKQNDGIRSLIVVGRTCLDSIQNLNGVALTCLDSIQELRESHDADYKKLRESHDALYKKLLEAQAVTEEKLNILIDTVDRIIRHRNGKE